MIKGTSHNKFYLVRIASKILVAVCLFLFIRPSYAWYCYTIQAGPVCSSNPNASQPSFPQTFDGRCFLGCETQVLYSFDRWATWSYSACKNWQAECANGEIKDPCEIYPSAAGCSNPEKDCQDQGGVWEDGECKFIDSTACEPFRAKCESQGGKFTGNLTTNGCYAYCNTCTSAYYNRQRNRFINACCGAGYAPPVDLDTAHCTGQGIATGPGMNYSDPLGCGGGVACDCKNPEDDPASFNQYCVGDERYDEDSPGYDDDDIPPDSADVPRDTIGSGEGDWEYNYYPILDTIRDSLVRAVVPSLRDIASCLTAGTCVGGGDTVIVNVESSDSVFIKQTNSKLDSVYDVIRDGDSALISAVQSIPVNSDSNYIKSTADSISAANDTTRKWLKRIADSLGVGTDSLIAHLDSIVKHIPDTLLDSILKYQRYAGDNFDSALYGKGKGFSLIDSLIDSTVKYLGEGTLSLESSLNTVADSIGGIGDRLDSMYNGNGSLPGDTSGSDIYDGWIDGEESDTTGNGYLIGLGSIAQAGLNDTSLDRIYGTNSSSSIGDTSIYSLPSVDSLHSSLQQSIVQDYQTLEDTLKNYFDTLRNEIQLINFDSAIIAPLGLKVPNTNTCPVDCFSIDLSGAGEIYSSVKGLSWPLCKSYSAMGGLNVLQFIRLILRIVTAIGCVYIGMWFIAGKK